MGPWTNALLSKDEFPYDKVIFLSTISTAVAVFYDESTASVRMPSGGSDWTIVTEHVRPSLIPNGVTVDMKAWFTQEPLITPKKRRSSKRTIR